jgi:hypothetical protein
VADVSGGGWLTQPARVTEGGIVGSGKRLFEDGSDQKKPLELVDSKTFSTGVLYLTYQPAQS